MDDIPITQLSDISWGIKYILILTEFRVCLISSLGLIPLSKTWFSSSHALYSLNKIRFVRHQCQLNQLPGNLSDLTRSHDIPN